LKAFKELFEKFNNVHLLYVGSTPKGQEFYLENLNHKITTLNLTQKVTIFPFTENIWSIYDSIDIVVVPSTEPESFGLVATEAMLSKKPVIASNIGGLKEIVVDNETGFLFNHKNVVDLQRKIELLVQDNELRKKMGEKGHIRVKEHFSSEKYVKKIEKLYDSFI
jgi:glycosyltransferase involved in cell wall biosynthesis